LHLGHEVHGDHHNDQQRALLLRWYFVVDHCGGHHGFHGPSAKLHDESTVRVLVEEGQFQNLTQLKADWVKSKELCLVPCWRQIK